MVRVFAGIDPGVSKTDPGAISLFDGRYFRFYKQWCSLQDSSDTLDYLNSSYLIEQVIIEDVQGDPRWHLNSSIKMMTNKAHWQALLTSRSISYIQKRPQETWGYLPGSLKDDLEKNPKTKVNRFLNNNFKFIPQGGRFQGVRDSMCIAAVWWHVFKNERNLLV